MARIFFLAALAALFFGGAREARAQSHSYINSMRSSTTTYVFIQQGVDGEYGKYTLSGKNKAEDGSAVPYKSEQYWKGYGISTTVGVELMKFVQFVAGHTFVNLRTRDDSLQSLQGSRLNAGARMVFAAPIANLELGAGLLGSRLDYQKELENSSFYGSGNYYSLGLDYFMSTRISVTFEAKLEHEHLARTGGSSAAEAIDTQMTVMGLGFRIWL